MADENLDKLYDLLRDREDKAREREAKRSETERVRHEKLLVEITEIKTHIKNCPSTEKIGTVDSEVKILTKDFKKHVSDEKWISIAKEFLRLLGAGVAGLLSGSIWSK